MRIVFAGTPDFACAALEQLMNDNSHEIVAVYTQPDRPAGRGKKLQYSAVKNIALSNDIPVLQPNTLKTTDAVSQLSELNADLLIVIAYGQLLPKAILDTPRYGCLNVHASILPRWRGAAPIQRSIEAGDTQTGVTLMLMDEGLDTGNMIATKTCSITSIETTQSLHDKLSALGAVLLIESLAKFESIDHVSEINQHQQNETNTCYAKKLTKVEALLDWNLPANVLDRKIRAFNPWPVCYFELDIGEEKKLIKVWEACVEKTNLKKAPGTILKTDKTGIHIGCGEHSLVLKKIQIPGAQKMNTSDVLNAKSHWFPVNGLL